MTFVQGGESKEAYTFAMEKTMQFAEAHYQSVVARLKDARGACSDFTGGCQSAYSLVHGAKHQDCYQNDEGVLISKVSCLLKGCVEHALPNLLYPGKTGWSKT